MIARRRQALSQLLEDGHFVRATAMPGADDLMMRVYAAMGAERARADQRAHTSGAGGGLLDAQLPSRDFDCLSLAGVG